VTLAILTWLWGQPGGRTDYTALHVNLWAAQVRRHCSLDIELACVTDMPEGISPTIRIIAPPGEFEDVRIPTWRDNRGGGLPQCFRRLAMFRPDAAEIFGERFVSMDLDCVIGGSLDPLFDRPEDFVMYEGTTPEARPYNGSMLLMTAGARPQVYAEFTPERAIEAGKRFLGSDQAWISHALGWGEATWGARDGVHWWGSVKRGNGTTDGRRLMFFPGQPKPWYAIAMRDPWIAEHYRLEGGRRGLILGPGASVWDDAERALDAGDFDGVIAFREPARHWPGEIAAVADNDEHAQQLAHMLGFDAVTWCGRYLTAVTGAKAAA
jgi:hypothetical protein